MIKKIIFIIFISFLVTGCTIEYNLNIDKDLNYNEEALFLEKNEKLKLGYESIKEGIYSKINSYYYVPGFDDYSHEIVYKSKVSGANFLSRKININYLKDSFFVKSFYENLELIQDKELITFKFKDIAEYNIIDGEVFDPNFYVEYLVININIPYKIISGNYDKIDAKNKMTWEFKNSSKEIEFVVDTSHYYDGEEVASVLKQEKQKSSIYLYIFGGILLIILGIAIYVYVKIYENN